VRLAAELAVGRGLPWSEVEERDRAAVEIDR